MRRPVAKVWLEPEPGQAALRPVVRPEAQAVQLVVRQAEQPEARQVVQQEALPVERRAVQQVAQQREAQRQPAVQPQLVESPER